MADETTATLAVHGAILQSLADALAVQAQTVAALTAVVGAQQADGAKTGEQLETLVASIRDAQAKASAAREESKRRAEDLRRQMIEAAGGRPR